MEFKEKKRVFKSSLKAIVPFLGLVLVPFNANAAIQQNEIFDGISAGKKLYQQEITAPSLTSSEVTQSDWGCKGCSNGCSGCTGSCTGACTGACARSCSGSCTGSLKI